jgi:hypothetical protein
MSKGGGGPVFNILAVVMLGLTALMCLCYTSVFFVPGLAGPFAGGPSAAQARVPTLTLTPESLLPPTWTPTETSLPVETETPFIVSTPGPTDTPRPTITFPPRPSRVTAGPSPTPSSTLAPYRFTHEVTYQPSPINPCGATYIVGTITDLEGKPVTSNNMIVHVEGDADIDTGGSLHPGEEFRGNRVQGRSPLTGMGFGPSAWDVIINLSGTSAGTWTVWLVQNGQASEKVQLRIQSDCADSSAIVRFTQNH